MWGSEGEEPLLPTSASPPPFAGPSASSTSAASTSYPPPPSTSRLERLAAQKGKRRSIPDEEDELEGSTAGPTGMNFCIRFTDGSPDLVDIWVGEKATVREVKRRIRFLRSDLIVEGRPRRLRLIQLGRLLTDGIFLVPYTVKLLSRRAKVVRQGTEGSGEALLRGAIEGLEAVGVTIAPSAGSSGTSTGSGVSARDNKGKGHVRDPSIGKGKSKEEGPDVLAGTEAEDDKRVWLHCSVGEAMEDEEIEGERVQTAQITPLQGFDRLRDAGFSDEDIASMREEFRSTAAGASIRDSDDQDEHARALEEQWMEGLTNQQEVANETVAGVYTTLLQGVCVGFFVPFLPLFFFRTSIFSARMQMAISFGMAINLGFGLLRAFS